jgi:hypothetical protein
MISSDLNLLWGQSRGREPVDAGGCVGKVKVLRNSMNSTLELGPPFWGKMPSCLCGKNGAEFGRQSIRI